MLRRRAGVFLVVQRRLRARSSPSRACAGRPSCAPRGRARRRRRSSRPGGVISPFCEPDIATSTPQASISNGMQPSEATASTISSASWPAARTAWPIASMSLTTPEAVSICATRIALIAPALSARSRASTASGCTARRKSPLSISDVAAEQRRRLAPADREAAAFEHQHLFAAREHVGECGLPGAVAVGDVDVGAALRAENLADVGEERVGERHQRAGIDVDRRPVHGAQHLVRHHGRTRDRQEFAAGADGHWAS